MAGMMAELVKVLAVKENGLSLIPRPHIVEGENQHSHSCSLTSAPVVRTP